MRTCRTCGIEKDELHFPKHGKDSYRPDCKICFYGAQKDRRAKGEAITISRQADRLVRLKPRKSTRTLHGKSTPNHPSRVAVAQRNAQIVEMRIRGATLKDIGRQFGLSSPGVHRALQSSLASVIVPEVDEYRKIQDLRLDVMLNALWEKIQSGDVDAIQTAIKIENTRAKLFGTFARDTTGELSGRPVIPIDLFRTMAEDAARARQKLAEARSLPAPRDITEVDVKNEIDSYIEGKVIPKNTE